MTLLISSSLVTVWMFSIVLGLSFGGLIHVLPLASAMTVVLRGNAPPRR
jgi:F0F1-type ATP synthase assembly protein I